MRTERRVQMRRCLDRRRDDQAPAPQRATFRRASVCAVSSATGASGRTPGAGDRSSAKGARRRGFRGAGERFDLDHLSAEVLECGAGCHRPQDEARCTRRILEASRSRSSSRSPMAPDPTLIVFLESLWLPVLSGVVAVFSRRERTQRAFCACAPDNSRLQVNELIISPWLLGSSVVSATGERTERRRGLIRSINRFAGTSVAINIYTSPVRPTPRGRDERCVHVGVTVIRCRSQVGVLHVRCDHVDATRDPSPFPTWYVLRDAATT
jgi:hypothetical protein